MRGRRWRMRAAKALVFLIVALMPAMMAAPPAGAAQLRMPSRAAIRSGLEDVWAWLTGAHQPAPVTPVQRSGSAAGRPHEVPAAVSRAVARATGRAPGVGRGELPAYRLHVPAARQDVTRPAPGTAVFNPRTSRLVAATMASDLYRNADGSYTRNVYAGPVNYRAASGAWLPVSTDLVTAGGRWRDGANSLAVSFAARADDQVLASLSSGRTGTSASFGITFGLAGAARVRGAAAGPTVTYRGVLAGTDLAETDTSTGIAERLVLHSANAPYTWIFPLILNGLTPLSRPDGSIWLLGTGGVVRGVIPAGLARDSATGPRTGPVGATAAVKYELVRYHGGPALRASIDPAWLASPARVFPVVVDPSVNAGTTGSTEAMSPFVNDYSGNTLLQVGTYDGGGHYARSFLAFNGLGSALTGEQITAASLHVWDAWAWTCGSAQPFWANEITASWPVTGNKTWPGPAINGNAMGETNVSAPSAACGNSAGNPSVGGWMTMTMNSTGLAALNDWTLHPGDDNGIALTNSTTTNSQWKQFDSSNTSNAPYLSLTYTADVPPQINSEYPPDNYSSPSLTPELLATGADPDNWPGSLQYAFTVYSSAGAQIASSGLISSGDWTVPAGDLAWGQQYYWTVQDYDGLDYSATPQVSYFGTPVPQPLITSGLSQNNTGPGFNAASGNWTTSATDAQIPSVGPALQVQRDYNSFDNRTTGAFGAGWSSVLDMQVGPGQAASSGATATEVVTYPDGQQVGFGQNSGLWQAQGPANGSLTSPSSLGLGLGPLASPPAAGVDASGNTYVYWKGPNDNLWEGIWNGSTWAGPYDRGMGPLGSQPTVAVTGSGTSYVFWEGTDGNLWEAQGPANGTLANKLNIGMGPLGSAPTAGVDSSGATYVYWMGASPSHDLMEGYWNGSKWVGPYDRGMGPLGSQPSVAVTGGGTAYVFWEGTDGNLWEAQGAANGALAGPAGRGMGPLGSAPAAGVDANGATYVYWRGTSSTNYDLVEAYWSGSAWVGPYDRGMGPLGPQPTVAVTGSGTAYVFGEAAGGTTYTAPPGRYATLKAVSGGFTLTDKNDTVYTFTQSLGSGSGAYGITSITDALGRSLAFAYNSSNQITTMTSASGRALHMTWTPPAGGFSPHVASVVTDPVTGTAQNTDLTWQYSYTGDQLTSVCPPVSTTACHGYAYTAGSDFPEAVLDSGPHSYLRLAETSGTSAASSVLVNEGTDNGTYSGVSLGAATGPLKGSTATAASFNGSSSYVTLSPSSLLPGSGYQSSSLWFKTTIGATDEVLLSASQVPLNGTSSPGPSQPLLYIGHDGKLVGEFWGLTTPLESSLPVNDGTWHMATLVKNGGTASLYVDTQPPATAATAPETIFWPYDYVGAGYLGANWPDEKYQDGDLGAYTATYFSGSISDVAFWARPVTATEVGALYSAGTHAAALATMVTRPSGAVYARVGYDPLTAAVTSVTDSNGGTWTVGAPKVTGSGQVYVSAVLGAQPIDYWRLADTGTTNPVDAGDQVNGGIAVYSTVTQGVTGGPFPDTTVDSFNGTSSYIQLPPTPMTAAGDQSVSLWFKTSTPNGVLYAYSAAPLTAHSTTANYVPALYIGADGKLNGQFWGSGPTNIVTPAPVDDGKWHDVVLSAAGTTQAMYLDGALVGTTAGTVAVLHYPYSYAGSGFIGGSWGDESHSGVTAATPLYFNGDLAEVAVYPAALTAAQVTTQWQASKYSTGPTPVQNVSVTDPGGKTLSYQYDPMNGDRILAQTDALGHVTKYGYDVDGFLLTVADPDGNVTVTGHDVRGNQVSQTTCQNQEAQKCSTAYYSYYPDDTTVTLTADPRNDMLLTTRNGRSASASDNTYLTSYTYDLSGDLTKETTPPVADFLSGRTTRYAYTSGGTSTTGGYQGAAPPAGLPYQEITPGGATTTTQYYGDGDVAQVTDPDGLITRYTYDGVGRVLTKTVISSTYPNGLVTTFAYNQMGQAVTETDPPVTDPVTGAVHTAQISTSYDPDGNVLSQTAADSSGGDASRTVSYTYDSHDLKASATDATGARTSYTYDVYGDLATQTDPAGDVTSYAYDGDGQLDTVTLDNYTADPANPSAPVSLVESSRAYDPAGRLESLTDSMGNTTTYQYTDNGLVATITRSGPGGSFTEQANTYDGAGNLTDRTTNNGATSTHYNVDAADRVTSTALDPSGLDRVTNVTYSPDNQVTSQSLSQALGTPARVTNYAYDPIGNMTSQSVTDPGAGGPAAWFPLTQTSGTAVTDSASGGQSATATGVAWNGAAAQFAGAAGQQVATGGPVLDTTGSFTVAAWVNLASTTTTQTVAAQAAGTDSGFYLKYNASAGEWEFTRPSTDAANPHWGVGSFATTAASMGIWTFLAGTYDAGTGTVQLYVNGSSSGTTTGADTTPFAASGPLLIGASKYNGAAADFFDGQIADVQVYPRALTASDVSALYGLGNGGSDVTTGTLTTSWTLDQRGLPTSMTNPDGNVTHYAYDEAGRLARTTFPAVTTQAYGGIATTAAPVTMTGHDTFGEPVESRDPNGNVTVTGYDGDGRAVSVTAPRYTPPGASSPITAAATKTYNGLGQVTAETDPLGNQTTYGYDQLGDVATLTTPDGGVTHYIYDTNGDQLSVTGPTGAQTQSTYDYLGRKVTSTQVERYPSAAAYTTGYAYGPGGWLASATSPDSVSTSYAYDAAGETLSVTDGAGNKTGYGYDVAGDRTSVTYPDQTQTTYGFDEAGRQTGSADLSATGATLRSASAAYDASGQLTAATDYRGDTTSFTYDPAGDLTAQTQPLSSSSSVTTSFGYDAAGNRTVYTDGNGGQWFTTYNSWNLPESRIEPVTSAYPTAAQSTFTIAYDGGGRPVTLTEPGGVSITDSYDTMGDLTGQSGSGAGAATASRSFGYDLAGDMTSAATTSTASGSQPSNATGESFSYNDRGLLLSASGSAGSSSFGYNGDGQVTSAATAAGTASYGYDNAGRLASMSDPATGATLTYTYNSLSQLFQISYGSGADVRAFGYNSLHQLTSDTLSTASGQTVASIGYEYDPNGNLISKTTSAHFTASAANTYTYDEANRLTSWSNGTTTTYGYDGAGNLTQSGSKTYTYDARDELTNDSANTYSYTANGTLASEVTGTGTASFTTDAYGQQLTENTQSYQYDALGRDLRVTTGTGGTAVLSYQGSADLLASDGISTYTYNPDGTLTGTGVVAGTPAQGVLDYTDRHTDLVGQFTAAGTGLSGSAGYDPWGAGLGSTLAGSLGYQSQFTDVVTGKVQMGARFYNPATGGFQDKDTATLNPVPNAAAANPFAYAADNPLTGTDPSGHRLCDDGVCGSAQTVDNAQQAAADACQADCQAAQATATYWAGQARAARERAEQARQQESACSGWTSWFSPSCDLHRVESWVNAAMHDAMHAADMAAQYTAEAARLAVRETSQAVVDAAKWGAHGAEAAWHTVQQAGSRAYHTAATWASEGYHAETHALATAYHAVARAATATTRFVENHAATIASIAVSVAVFAGCEAATEGVGTIGCAALAGAAGNAVSYAITAAQTGKFSWSGLGQAALTGAVTGALTGGIAEGASSLLAGAAGSLLRSGASEAGDALATGATEEAASATTESAATTADATSSGAAEDAGARAGATADEGGQGAQNECNSCACGGESFTAATKVLTASGVLVAISKLAKGDRVLATSTKTGKNQGETVAAVLVHHDTDLYDLKVRSGGRTAVIDTTSNHLFWVPGTRGHGRWVKAAALRHGTHLRTPSGTDAVVTGGYVPRQHNGWMWDLTVTSDHDFYVQAAPTVVLVHNCPPDEPAASGPAASGPAASGPAASGPAGSGINANDLTMTRTVEQHITDVGKDGTLSRPYGDSRLVIQEIMDAAEPTPDPGGVPGALRWDVPGTMGKSSGTWELVVNPETKMILHFLFRGGR